MRTVRGPTALRGAGSRLLGRRQNEADKLLTFGEVSCPPGSEALARSRSGNDRRSCCFGVEGSHGGGQRSGPRQIGRIPFEDAGETTIVGQPAHDHHMIDGNAFHFDVDDTEVHSIEASRRLSRTSRCTVLETSLSVLEVDEFRT